MTSPGRRRGRCPAHLRTERQDHLQRVVASASYGGYAGGAVRYSTKAGSAASFTFTGKKVVWYGPTGPTRGTARVSIDGTYVKTVDLRRSSFSARVAVYSGSWTTAGRHTIGSRSSGPRATRWSRSTNWSVTD